MFPDTKEELNELRNIINRSQNRANQAKFKIQTPFPQVFQEIDRDFSIMKFVAQKHCPHHCDTIDRIHHATIATMNGQLSEKEFEKILNGLIKGAKHNRAGKHHISKKNYMKPFQEAQKIFIGWR